MYPKFPPEKKTSKMNCGGKKVSGKISTEKNNKNSGLLAVISVTEKYRNSGFWFIFLEIIISAGKNSGGKLETQIIIIEQLQCS